MLRRLLIPVRCKSWCPNVNIQQRASPQNHHSLLAAQIKISAYLITFRTFGSNVPSRCNPQGLNSVIPRRHGLTVRASTGNALTVTSASLTQSILDFEYPKLKVSQTSFSTPSLWVNAEAPLLARSASFRDGAW